MSAKNLNPWGSICRNVIIFLTILGGQFPEMGGQFGSEYIPKCSMFDKCLKSLYAYEDNPPFEMSNDCNNKQWLKHDKCFMTESLKYYKVYGKHIIQGELPLDMQ
jgi:hypothetical protein